MKFLLCFLLSALSAIAPLGAFPFQVPEKIVGRILLESDGPLVRVSPQECLKLIQLKEGQPYDASAVKYSIERLYATAAFFDIQVQLVDGAEGRVDVVFRLARLYRIQQLHFKGDLKLERSQLRSQMAIRSEAPYSDRLVEQGVAQLQEFYRRHGYYQARLRTETRVNEREASLELIVEVQAGLEARVASVEIQAQGQIEEAEVLERIHLRAGQAYSQQDLEESLHDLEQDLALQGFLEARAAIASQEYDPSANQVKLRVEVDSGSQQHLEFNGVKLSREELLRLPVFGFRSLSQALAGETEARLVEMHQEKGYFQARATHRSVPSPDGSPGLIFDVEPGSKSKLASIVFEGNQTISSDVLQDLVQARPAKIFKPGRFSTSIAERDQESIRNHYRSLGYQQVQVSHQLQADETDSKRLTLVYRIEEGPVTTIRFVSLLGNQQEDKAELLKQVRSAAGKPFSPFQAAQDRQELIAFYEDKGYRQADCRVEASFIDDASVDLSFFIQEGAQTFIDDVVVVGELNTHPPVIRQQLRVKPGDPLSLRSILQTETNLHDLAIFDRVDLEEVETSDRPDARTVVISLNEAPRFTFLYGIGYSSFEGPRGTVGLTDNNFRGRAQVLALGARASPLRQRANLSWTVRRVRGLELPTVFSLTALNQEARTGQDGATNTLQGRPFDELRFTFSARSERPLSRRESLFFGWRFERVDATLPPGLEEDTRLEFFRQPGNLRLGSLELSYINESRDEPSDPRQGFFLAGDTTFSSRILASEEEFYRLLLQGSYYWPLPKGFVLASALRLGWIRPFGRTQSDDGSNPVPISERFFSGGSTSLRGLPQDMAGPLLVDENGDPILVDDQGQVTPDGRPVALGGNALFVANIELRAPLWRSVGGTLFYDTGNVFRDFSSIGLSGFSNTFGFGVRIGTPVGPIRIDAGYNPNPPDAPGFRHWLFHVSLGNAF